ncbi:hypothetical protein CKM354_000287100 [Cercospora kikuchii]|uniref:Uncharacterized protein n=1 Tax=Cercospora kikuchii TaxID=84275 RepID=A0A9P3C8F5_9PEZI|nr:uncharacterized protein CKM354_000287100 [Cercospora kikuchii]GIZ39489.1 hypothetical protein CKM354_000287100 [Cercospora kikuchii]
MKAYQHIRRAGTAALLSAILLPSATATTKPQHASSNFTSHAHSLLTQSMTFMDQLYDPIAGYLYRFDTALLHDTRSSSWYAAGLLARASLTNTSTSPSDISEAIQVITNIITPQFTNTSEQWYGDYQSYPEQPYPGTEQYPATIYNTWDPNWRGFIGTAFIVILEEYSHLLPASLQNDILASLRLNAIGDTYRVGGVDDDNLYPFYSNAAIMKAAVGSYIGHRLQDANLTNESEAWGREIVELFDEVGGSLSEFNGPTYTGVSLTALTVWAKYLPSNSSLKASGERMIRRTWEEFGELYNANMKQITGPWDRSYGYDESKYLSIMSLWIWALVGLEASPFGPNFKPWAIAHNDDFEIGPLVAILTKYHVQQGWVGEKVMRSLTEFEDPGEEGRLFTASAYSYAYDHVPRNITSWISANLTIGAESFDMNVVGGPARNPSQFNPAVAQWLREDGSVGFLTLYPETQALQAEVGPRRLNLTYPYGNATSKFVFHVSPNGLAGPRNVYSWDDILGVGVKVSGSVRPEPEISFCGNVGGACDPVNEFDLWNFTYSMSANDTRLPNIVLDFELV